MPVDSGRRQLWINDREISDIAAANGFRVDLEAFTNVRGGVADRLATSPAPGRFGQVVTSAHANADKGVMTFNLRVMVSSLAALNPAIDTLTSYFMTGGRLRIRTDMAPTRECFARIVPPYTTQEEEPYNGNAVLILNLELDDPLFHELTGRRYSLPNGIRIPLPTGTGPSNWFARVRGPFTNAVLTYRDARGTIISQLKIAASTVPATEWFDITSDEILSVYAVVSGARSTLADGLALLDPASTEPIISPTNGFGTAAFPTLTLTDDLGTASGFIAYKKSYR